eukprot:9812182-Alexandrium_andersonii.AAC.1
MCNCSTQFAQAAARAPVPRLHACAACAPARAWRTRRRQAVGLVLSFGAHRARGLKNIAGQ